MKALELAFERFNRLVDWFIPDEMAADRTMRKQAQMFLVSHICGPFIGNSVPLAVLALDPHPGFTDVVLAASITGFWIFPFLLKLTKQYNILAILSIQNLMFCIIWSCLMLGGIQSPTAPWILTIPLLSFFYLGSSSDIRLLILLMFIANFTGLWIVSGTAAVEPSHIATIAAEVLGVVSTLAAAAYVAMMALFYARALASQGELETEIRDHVEMGLNLRTAAAAAARADAAKSAFLTRLSGDMRLPLHAVIGYSSILIEEAEEQRATECIDDLKSIHAGGLELLRLVNDILDLSRIEDGRMEIYGDVFRPVELLGDLVRELTPSANVNGNMLSLVVEGAIDRFASDRRKIRIVLIQLISNAIKFTADGRIEVRVWIEPANGFGLSRLKLSITDTGIGIEPEKMASLFEQFALNNDAQASKYGGSGLGLALSYKLCRLLGGNIDVETSPGRGSCFTVTIPAASTDLEQDADPDGGDLSKRAARPITMMLPRAEAVPLREVA